MLSQVVKLSELRFDFVRFAPIRPCLAVWHPCLQAPSDGGLVARFMRFSYLCALPRCVSRLDGFLYVLPAPGFFTTVVAKNIRNVQTKHTDDGAIGLSNLHQFNYLGFAMTNYKSGYKYIATDVEYIKTNKGEADMNGHRKGAVPSR